MSWIITKDHVADEGANPGTNSNAVGMEGPGLSKGWTVELEKKAGREPKAFRVYDDDGTLYYEGFATLRDDETGFEPLDDFGAPNAGCTYIEYLIKGKWEAL